MPSDNNREISLSEWFKEDHDDSERRDLFLYMDFAMRYCHDRGYCIKTFDPREIAILNDSVKQVKFNTLIKMPDDDYYQNKLMNEDILNSSLLQVGLYANCLKYINPDYLKDNFDSFLPFLPETDAQYYRGVIESGAAVYFTEFELERIKRNKNNLEKELSDGKNNTTPSDNSSLDSMFDNDKINNEIYRKINVRRDSAFIHTLLYPIIFVIIVLVLLLILYFNNYIHF